MTEIDQELVDLYVQETKLSEFQVRLFVKAGIEPPHRDVVDQIGWTSAFRKDVIDPSVTPAAAQE